MRSLILVFALVCAVSCRHIESSHQEIPDDAFEIPVSLSLKGHSEETAFVSDEEFSGAAFTNMVRLPVIYDRYSVNDYAMDIPVGLSGDKTLLDDWSRE